MSHAHLVNTTRAIVIVGLRRARMWLATERLKICVQITDKELEMETHIDARKPLVKDAVTATGWDGPLRETRHVN